MTFCLVLVETQLILFQNVKKDATQMKTEHVVISTCKHDTAQMQARFRILGANKMILMQKASKIETKQKQDLCNQS